MRHSIIAVVVALVLVSAVQAQVTEVRDYVIGFRFQSGDTGSTTHTHFADNEIVNLEMQIGTGPITHQGQFTIGQFQKVQHESRDKDGNLLITFPALEVRKTITPADYKSGIRLVIRTTDGKKIRGARGITVYVWGSPE